ncbi:MAG: hypothetical protein QOJ81_2122 [Chloroflexota bacterium]|jgi:hypothetical protein|nr:hypothetical protein [Chloroflexota bacterium]
MESVIARVLQPTWVLVGLVAAIVLATILVLLGAAGAIETDHLVAPFRWAASEPIA